MLCVWIPPLFTLDSVRHLTQTDGQTAALVFRGEKNVNNGCRRSVGHCARQVFDRQSEKDETLFTCLNIPGYISELGKY